MGSTPCYPGLDRTLSPYTGWQNTVKSSKRRRTVWVFSSLPFRYFCAKTICDTGRQVVIVPQLSGIKKSGCQRLFMCNEKVRTPKAGFDSTYRRLTCTNVTFTIRNGGQSINYNRFGNVISTTNSRSTLTTNRASTPKRVWPDYTPYYDTRRFLINQNTPYNQPKPRRSSCGWVRSDTLSDIHILSGRKSRLISICFWRNCGWRYVTVTVHANVCSRVIQNWHSPFSLRVA